MSLEQAFAQIVQFEVERQVKPLREAVEALSAAVQVPSNENARLLTTKEVAEMCQVEASTVRSWIKAGALPALELGAEFRVERVALKRYLERRLTTTMRAVTPAPEQPSLDSEFSRMQNKFAANKKNAGGG